jgi:cytochrome P450
MSAASFGGSFELSRTDNSKLTNMFHDRLKKTCLNTLFPFLKYLPFMPSLRSPEMDEMIQGIISKRRKAMEAREPKQDLLQVLIDTHDANPEEFTMMHVHEEMRVFMFVVIVIVIVIPLKISICYSS